MTEKEKSTLLQEMLLRIEDLVVVIDSDSHSGDAIELDQARVGRLARMDAVQHHAIALAQVERAKKQLAAINRLLGRIDQDDFGECLYCGEDIPIQRLMIRPESVRCVLCADKD